MSTVRKVLIIVFVLCWVGQALYVKAQKKLIDPQRAHLYQYDHDWAVRDFYKQHEPLDGAEVSYIPFRKDERYGFVDKQTRKWVIQPVYTQVYAVYADGAIVADEEGHYGVIDKNGKFKVVPSFRNLFKEGKSYKGLISGLVDTTYPQQYHGTNGTFYFDEQGHFLFNVIAHRQEDFHPGDSLSWSRFGTVFTVINRQGDTMKQFPYTERIRFCGIFNNTLVYETRESSLSRYTGFDVLGNTLFSIEQEESMKMVFRINDTMFGSFSDDGLFFVDNTGRPYPFGIYNGMVGFGFESLLSYVWSRPCIVVQHPETHLFGLLSPNGKFLLPCSYRYLGAYANGELAYMDTASDRVGFIDTNGHTTVPPVLRAENTDRLELAGQELQYSEGLCLVYGGLRSGTDEERSLRYRIGYADRSGKLVITLPDSIILAGPFSCGLAPVVAQSGRLGFINKQGKLAIPLKYEAAVQGAYPFPEVVLPRFSNGFAYLKAFKGYIDTSGYEYFSGKQVKDHYNFSH